MQIDGQALVDKMRQNFAQKIAISEQEIAMLQVQNDNLQHELNTLKGKKDK